MVEREKQLWIVYPFDHDWRGEHFGSQNQRNEFLFFNRCKDHGLYVETLVRIFAFFCVIERVVLDFDWIKCKSTFIIVHAFDIVRYAETAQQHNYCYCQVA